MYSSTTGDQKTSTLLDWLRYLGCHYDEKLQQQQQQVAQEFGTFLHRMIASELEDLGRSSYTAAEMAIKTDPLLDKLVDLKSLLTSSTTNVVVQLRMVAAALGTSSSQLQLSVKRSSSTLQNLYQLFVKVKVQLEDDWRQVMRYFSAWKMAICTAYEIIYCAKQTHPNRDPPRYWTRDQLCETMKRALSQHENAQALVYLAERSDFERSWTVSVLEYLLLYCNEDHVCRTAPLFQQWIVYNPKWKPLIGLAIALFSAQNLMWKHHFRCLVASAL